MKHVFLLDCNKKVFHQLIDESNDVEAMTFLDTSNLDELSEYQSLGKSIMRFSSSNDELLLVRFSGRDSIIKELGDLFSVMIVSLSCNPEKNYYYENIQEKFLELLNKFKETK